MSPQELTDKVVEAINLALSESDMVKNASDADKQALKVALGTALQATVPKVNVLQTPEDADLDDLEMKNLKSAEADPMGMYMIAKGKTRSRVTNVRKEIQRMISDTRQGRVDYRNSFTLQYCVAYSSFIGYFVLVVYIYTKKRGLSYSHGHTWSVILVPTYRQHW